MRAICVALAAILLGVAVPALGLHRPPLGPYKGSRHATGTHPLLDQERSRSDELIAQCSVEFRDTQLDHFSWVRYRKWAEGLGLLHACNGWHGRLVVPLMRMD